MAWSLCHFQYSVFLWRGAPHGVRLCAPLTNLNPLQMLSGSSACQYSFPSGKVPMHVWPFFVSDSHCVNGVGSVSSSESWAHIPPSNLFLGFRFGILRYALMAGTSHFQFLVIPIHFLPLSRTWNVELISILFNFLECSFIWKNWGEDWSNWSAHQEKKGRNTRYG